MIAIELALPGQCQIQANATPVEAVYDKIITYYLTGVRRVFPALWTAADGVTIDVARREN